MPANTPAPELFKADHYHFDLPKERIAQHPLERREDARMMHVRRDTDGFEHYHIRDFDQLLNENDCLVVNNTRVVPAKLTGIRTLTGGRWRGLFLEADENGNWRVLCKTRGKAQPGEKISLIDRQGVHQFLLTLVARLDDGSWVVHPDAPGEWAEQLNRVGHIPLPNYIRGGNMVDADVKNYQTVYAKNAGAVAAPTAGLHLTESLLRRVIDRGVKISQVTLHVGVGTFRPVKSDNLEDHDMHFERGSIDQKSVDTIKACKSRGGRVIAIGTTSVRVLETAAADGELAPWSGETNLFIKPDYQFKAVDALLTNFHLPRSTLLVMIRTFGGDQLISRAYQAALEEEYRFYSYGDAMLIT